VALSVKEFPIKPVAAGGRYYKRIKNSNHRLSLSEISNIYPQTFNSSWGYYIDDQHSLNDISLEKVIAFARKNLQLVEEKKPLRLLQKYELLRDGRITKAAFLLFVKDFTALTGIEAGRFKSPTKIIDSASFHSDLFTEVEQVLTFLRRHFMVEYIITGNAQREERVVVSKTALKTDQKRDLKNDLEGDLEGDLKRDLKNDLKRDLKNDETDKLILQLITYNKHISILEIAQQTKKGITFIKKRLAKLKQLNRIERIGPDKGGFWQLIMDNK
jgi:predicted HTH transcriptional regulator